jgi:uncharacterized membrane protein
MPWNWWFSFRELQKLDVIARGQGWKCLGIGGSPLENRQEAVLPTLSSGYHRSKGRACGLISRRQRPRAITVVKAVKAAKVAHSTRPPRQSYCYNYNMLQQLQAILYFFGHGFCHQLPERSFEAGGLYFSVCARDTGIYLGLVFTAAIIYIYYLRVKIKPSGLPPAWALVVCGLLLLPMAVDGASSYIGLRQTTNLLRYITGYLAGTGIGFLASCAILGFRRDAIYTKRVVEKPTQLATILTASVLAGAAFYLLYPYLGIAAPILVVVAQMVIMTCVNLIVMNMAIKKGLGHGRRMLGFIAIAIVLALIEIALLAIIAHGFYLIFPDFVHP